MKEFYTIYELFDINYLDGDLRSRNYICHICSDKTISPFNHLVYDHRFDYRSEKNANAQDSNVMISHQRYIR